MNKLEEASKYYIKALFYDPDCILVHRNYALVLEAANDNIGALEHLSYALYLCLKDDPNYSWYQQLDVIDCDHVSSDYNADITDIMLLMGRIIKQNIVQYISYFFIPSIYLFDTQQLFEDYEEGKKMLS